VKRTDEVGSAGTMTRAAGRKLDFVIIGLLSLALTAVLIDQYIIPAGNARLGPRSVIVLPFSSNQDEQAGLFADGLLGEILTQLYKIEALTTVGRATAMYYRGSDKPVGLIAEELGVAAVVSGNLIEAAGQVRFDVELLEARTGRMLWVNSYELPQAVEGLFDVQSDIARQIAHALKAELSPAEQQLMADRPATSEVAYDHYLRGEGYRQRTRLQEAIDEYEQATKEDPDFAAAWAALAKSRADANYLELAAATMEQAEFALEQARRLAPEALDTIFAEAVLLGNSYRFEEAIEQLYRVLELQPGAVEPLTYLSGIYTVQLRLDEAREFAERAVALDPMSIDATSQLAFILTESWNFEEARRYNDRLLALEPESPHSWRFWGRYNVYLWGLGDRAAARRILDEAPATISTIYGEIQLAYVNRDLQKMQELLETTEGDRFIRYWSLARLHRLKGDVDLQRKFAESMRLAAETAMEARLSRGGPPIGIEWSRSDIALALALAGNEVEAIRTIELAVERASADPDRLNAVYVHKNEVMTYTFLGHKDTAIERLRSLLSWAKPRNLTPYRLRMDPDFDALRGHPDFEALLEELASGEN
jgi:TolB-like protein/cytochrome c-type biogenesis protein CcmH/NrfG